MKARFLLLAALSVVVSSCGTTPSAPTSPLMESIPVLPSVGSQSFGTTMDWSCFTASRAGIFGSAATGCSATAFVASAKERFGAAAVAGPSGNLSAAVNGSTVTLTWAAPTSSDPATSYMVEAGSSSGAANIASLDTGNAATTLTVASVPAGTYFVRVRARNSSGVGAASNEVTFTVGSTPCAGAPGAPTGLQGSVSGSRYPYTITLTWIAPAGTCAPASYVLEAGQSSGSSDRGTVSTGNAATTYSLSGVNAGGFYFVRVRARNVAGTSEPSNEIRLNVGAPASCTGNGGAGGSMDMCGTWMATVPVGPETGQTLTFDFVQQFAVFSGTYTSTSGRIGLVGGNTPSSRYPNVEIRFAPSPNPTYPDEAIFVGAVSASSGNIVTAVSGEVRMGVAYRTGTVYSGPAYPMTFTRR